MGLDMYFFLEDKETKELIEYSYYRKFNALQGYFHDKHAIPNCGKVRITEDIREELYTLLNEIMFNREKAPELLPVHPGPFFGSYDYDRVYHHYIDEACKDMYHAKFIDTHRYHLYFTSNW